MMALLRNGHFVQFSLWSLPNKATPTREIAQLVHLATLQEGKIDVF